MKRTVLLLFCFVLLFFVCLFVVVVCFCFFFFFVCVCVFPIESEREREIQISSCRNFVSWLFQIQLEKSRTSPYVHSRNNMQLHVRATGNYCFYFYLPVFVFIFPSNLCCRRHQIVLFLFFLPHS